jgi:hypothetical protein
MAGAGIGFAVGGLQLAVCSWRLAVGGWRLASRAHVSKNVLSTQSHRSLRDGPCSISVPGTSYLATFVSSLRGKDSQRLSENSTRDYDRPSAAVSRTRTTTRRRTNNCQLLTANRQQQTANRQKFVNTAKGKFWRALRGTLSWPLASLRLLSRSRMLGSDSSIRSCVSPQSKGPWLLPNRVVKRGTITRISSFSLRRWKATQQSRLAPLAYNDE